MDKDKKMPSDSPINTKKLLPTVWPEHDEFFERALAVKPHLRVTISSLQSLILLQWYIYTPRSIPLALGWESCSPLNRTWSPP
ncbi:hypothetical protein AZE42_12355 [Rhizopogon vesiculosus]|uniref:Uncharacterized protein n=1 Tax=Rhizopogon vesiculosus TaxID=180088 RepID=A0A1J8QTK2_9AGAM|nr:hypothetical protein AZE42_12355 [Rhizopogon vesiculosus]